MSRPSFSIVDDKGGLVAAQPSNSVDLIKGPAKPHRNKRKGGEVQGNNPNARMTARSTSRTRGGEPPKGGGLEDRVKSLEKALPDIRERLAGIEATVSSIQTHTATKADLSKLESTMVKWYVATAFAMTSVFAGITFTAVRILSS